MNEVSIIGLDLAKSVFQAHGAGAFGSVIFSRKLSRAQLLKFMGDQPRGPTPLGGGRPYFRNDHVEKIEDIVLGACFERPNERQQGGSSTLVRHPGDCLCFGGIGESREREDARRWQFIGSQKPRSKLPYFAETFDRPREFGRALKRRSRSKPVHWALPLILGNDRQGVQTLLLIRCDPRCQQAPKATVGTHTHPGNCPADPYLSNTKHSHPISRHWARVLEKSQQPYRSRISSGCRQRHWLAR